jgi:hypothetical protein
VLARDLDLTIIQPPIRLPTIDIHQYWHDRFHREPGNQWIRSVFARLFTRRRGGTRLQRERERKTGRS